jgi:hypothetical protein
VQCSAITFKLEPLKINVNNFEYDRDGSMKIGNNIYHCIERHTMYYKKC